MCVGVLFVCASKSNIDFYTIGPPKKSKLKAKSYLENNDQINRCLK